VPVHHTLETVSSTLFDGVVLPGGLESVGTLLETPGAVGFVLEAFRHRKAIGGSREAVSLLEAGGLDVEELRAEGWSSRGSLGSGAPTQRISSPRSRSIATGLGSCLRS
jgi:catalase